MTLLNLLRRVDKDVSVCQMAVPAHMLVLMAEECMKINLEFRMDAMHKLNMAAAAPLAQSPPAEVSRLAGKIDSIATTLLTQLNPDDPRDGLYICAEFCLMLVAEGYWKDATNQAVLVSMLLIDDVKDDSPDIDGRPSVWREQEDKWQKKARDLILRAQLQGLYLRM